MAKRKKRRSTRSRKQQEFPGWAWMLFGLSIGLSVAFAVYVRDGQPIVATAAPEPASLQSALDKNSEPESTTVAAAPKEKRFTFYDLLPNIEVTIPESETDIRSDIELKAIVEPGVYVLQAGSFSTNDDADRRRAELALQGIESHIVRVKINDRNYHRVYVGPTEDLDELNLLRSRLRAAKIDVLRIRLSD